MDNNLNMMSTPPGAPAENKRSLGLLIGLVVIILVILVGGIYFWSMRGSLDYGPVENSQNNSPTIQENGAPVPSESQILNQSSSDAPDTIETDLNAFGEAEIDTLDSELQ